MKKFGLGLVLAILIQTLTGIAVFASDEIKIEIEDYIKEESADVKVLPGGTGKTASCQPGQYTTHIVEIAAGGVYSMYASGAATSDVRFDLEIDGKAVDTAAFPATCTDWSVYDESKIGDIRLTEGTHKFKFTYNAGIAFDYAVLREASREHTLGGSNFISAIMYEDAAADEDEESITISDGGYAVYALKSETDRIYTLKINAACASANTTVEVALNDNVLKTATVKNTLSEETFYEYFIVNIGIPAGESRIKFTVNGGDMVFKSFMLNKFSTEDAVGEKPSATVYAVDYLKDGQDVTFHDSTPDSIIDENVYMMEYFPVEVWHASHGLIVYSDTTEWYTFETNIPEDGTYDVYIHFANTNAIKAAVTTEDGTKTSLNSVTGGDWNNYTEHHAGTVSLTAGKQRIRIDIESGDGNVTYYKFVKRLEKPELYAITAGTDIIAQNSVVKRGIETITAYFTDYLKDNANVTVSLSNGEKTLPVTYEISGNAITVTLLESLQYETEYTLEFSGVSSVTGGIYEQDMPMTFKTGTDENDKGSGKFVSGEAGIKENVFTITGTVSTESGIGMAGRGVYATFKNGATYTSDKIYSEKDGKFTLNYILPENAAEGEYVITVFTDYATRSERLKFNIIYVSAETETRILDAVNSAADWEEAKAVIEADDTYKLLALTGKSYVKKLDNERFYKHFLNKNYKTKEEFIKDYNKILAFERINQEKTKISTLKTLMNDKDNCTHLGIEYGKVMLLSNTADEFYNEVLAMELYDDADEFVKTINSMLNEYMLKEFEISNPELLAENISTYVGKTKDISISLKDKPKNVHKVTYTIECPSEDIANDTDTKDLTAEKKGKMIYITSETADEIKIAFSSGTAGKYEFKISAVVEYSVSETETCAAETAEKTFTAEVKTNSSSGTGGGSSSGGSGGGKTNFSPIIVPNAPTNPTEPEISGFNGFSDMKEAKWAEENVNRLVEKNVISKADKFRPNDYITREEFVKMAVTAFGLYDETAKADFKDVSADTWYAPYIASAYVKGIVTGNPDGSFGVGKNITRQEMAVILCRILNAEYAGEAEDKFADDEKIAGWAKAAVYEMKKRGIINGVGENIFEPESCATRAMAARMIDFMMSEVAK